MLINLGTPTTAQVESMRLAAAAAQKAGKPWVLDPIAAGGLPWRGAVAAELLQFRPAIVRGNASEIIGLAGLGGGGRGVDSSADPAAAVPAAVDLLAHAAAVSASGPVDHAVGLVGGRPMLVRIGGGDAMLTRVTATGCALGALAAAYASVAPDALTGLVAAHVHFAVAAEIAAASAKGPGSFAVGLRRRARRGRRGGAAAPGEDRAGGRGRLTAEAPGRPRARPGRATRSAGPRRRGGARARAAASGSRPASTCRR